MKRRRTRRRNEIGIRTAPKRSRRTGMIKRNEGERVQKTRKRRRPEAVVEVAVVGEAESGKRISKKAEAVTAAAAAVAAEVAVKERVAAPAIGERRPSAAADHHDHRAAGREAEKAKDEISH